MGASKSTSMSLQYNFNHQIYTLDLLVFFMVFMVRNLCRSSTTKKVWLNVFTKQSIGKFGM